MWLSLIRTALILFCVLFSTILLDIFSLSYSQSFVLSYLYTIVIAILFFKNKSFRQSTPANFILFYSLVQAVGIPIAYILNPEYADFRMMRENYFYGNYADKYISLSLLSLSLIIFMMLRKNNTNYEYADEQILPPNKVFYRIGLTLLLAFSVYISFKAIVGAIPFGNYELYKEMASYDSIQNYLQKGYFMCSVFICSAGSKKQILISLLIFLIPSGILLAAGNRNDILFPFLIGIGLYSVRFRRTPKMLLLALALFIFVISPFIVSYRTGNSVQGESIQDNMTEKVGESLFELGGQMAPVASTFNWLEKGEEYALGKTYLYSVYALFGGFLSSDIRHQYENSPYCIGARLPGFGYAMSAEVYYNWGILGIFIAYLLLGSFISNYEINRQRLVRTEDYLKYGFFMLWILILVRNAFAYSFIDAIIFYILYQIGRNLQKSDK